MDIPALSMALSQGQVIDQIGTAVLSMTLDLATAEGSNLIDMMEASVSTRDMELSVHPELGANVDIRL